ncbi:DNA gyrase, B subunit, C-terminal domain protein, partial [Bacteriovorax sp. DB6_IX]
YNGILKSYDIHFDTLLLRKIIEDSDITSETLKDASKLETELKKLTEYFKTKEAETLREYSFDVVEDTVHQTKQVKITVKTTARTKKFKLGTNFLDSPEFADLLNTYDGIKKYMTSHFAVSKEKGETVEYESLQAFADFIIADGKQGAYIQRYKGLGEMNPEQLWETTMNPENRSLLQVQVEDSIEADSVFSVLMGDQVEPRREFVEQNALNARNLDV